MKYSRRNFIKTASIATVGSFIPADILPANKSALQINDNISKIALTGNCGYDTSSVEKALNVNPAVMPLTDWKLGTSLSLTTPDIEKNMLILKEAGIDYVEVGMHSSKDMELAKIITLVNDYKKAANITGINIWSIHIPFGWNFDISLPDPILRERSRQEILLTLKLAKGLGPYQKAILHPSYEPIDEALRTAHIASFRTSMKELGPLVEEEYNVRLAIECLPRTCLGNSASEMMMLVGDIPSVDVCMDTNHLLNEKTEYFAEKLNNRIQTIHVSDYDGIDERHWLPGKGIINFPAVINALVKSGYKGPFMYEVSINDYDNDMQSFANDLVSVWKNLIKGYEAYIKREIEDK
ncbi:MAG: sugar phosphate isomerase/epimerase [Parabacteroides sp.]|nr:sugar phosphate isomerase/epimerase [Parabacteroides sp.]